jgi:hypothetical protein
MTVIGFINEGSTGYLAVEFLDKAGAASVPSSISYRIDDVISMDEILDDTTVTAAAEIEITLGPSVNVIVDQKNRRERRLVTITATYGADDALVKEYEYDVKNIKMIVAEEAP